MPRSSELFPIAKTPTSTPTSTTDTTPPRIVLLDKPIPAIAAGKLMVNIRTLLIDDAITIVQSSAAKPKMSWVSKSQDSVSTIAENPIKIQIRIEE